MLFACFGLVKLEVISKPSTNACEILKFLTIYQCIVKNKVICKSDSYSAYVVYTKTIIKLKFIVE